MNESLQSARKDPVGRRGDQRRRLTCSLANGAAIIAAGAILLAGCGKSSGPPTTKNNQALNAGPASDQPTLEQRAAFARAYCADDPTYTAPTCDCIYQDMIERAGIDSSAKLAGLLSDTRGAESVRLVTDALVACDGRDVSPGEGF